VQRRRQPDHGPEPVHAGDLLLRSGPRLQWIHQYPDGATVRVPPGPERGELRRARQCASLRKSLEFEKIIQG
jgi:hypothetical protein